MTVQSLSVENRGRLIKLGLPERKEANYKFRKKRWKVLANNLVQILSGVGIKFMMRCNGYRQSIDAKGQWAHIPLVFGGHPGLETDLFISSAKIWEYKQM